MLIPNFTRGIKSMNINLISYICIVIKKNIRAFIVTFLIGFITHAYIFTNILPNHDTLKMFFTNGETYSSGRWGLGILSHILPQCNMPWLNGIVTIFLISASVCILIDVFEIKISALQYLLGGLIITFPSLIVTFMYMFTSACYGLSIFLMTLAVRMIIEKSKSDYIAALTCFVFSLSIYQAYLFFFSSIMIVYLIKCCLENKRDIFKNAMKYIMFILLSLLCYFAINFLFMTVLDIEFNSYSQKKLGHSWAPSYIIKQTIRTYIEFIYQILFNHYKLVISKLSGIMHIVIILSGLIFSVMILKRNKKSLLTFFILFIILPVSINGLIVIGGEYTLNLYSFSVIYILFAVIIQQAENNIIVISEKFNVKLSNIFVIPAMLIILLNIAGANKSYINMKLADRNTEAFYTSLVTQIKSNPNFKKGTRIALVGKTDNTIWDMQEFGGNIGVDSSKELINAYSKEYYIKYFIGFDVDFANDEEIKEIAALPEFAEMEEYPYYNSVKALDNYIVVKFSDVE